jgi:uncharacterized protein
MGRIAIWVKPRATEDGIEWDDWRKRWNVSCRAAPTGGAANRAVEQLLAGWLEVPGGRVHIEHGTTSHAKTVVVEGLTDRETVERLDRQTPGSGRDRRPAPR